VGVEQGESAGIVCGIDHERLPDVMQIGTATCDIRSPAHFGQGWQEHRDQDQDDSDDDEKFHQGKTV
jgi:hypothetical protein